MPLKLVRSDSNSRLWGACVSRFLGELDGHRTQRDALLSEWYARLRRLLESNEIAISGPSQRGVQVREAHEAALTPFRHAFVIHANEGVFPPRTGGGLDPGGLRHPAPRGSRRSSKPPGVAVRGTVGGRRTAAGEDRAEDVAAGYVIQARAYHDAAASLLAHDHDGRPRVRLHFTHPNVVVEIPVGADEKMLSEPLQPS